MANPMFSKEGVKEKLRESPLRDIGQSDVVGSAREALNQVGDRAGEMFENATSWLQENRGRALIFTAIFVSAGLLGFFIGRGTGSEGEPERY